ncbi:MAG: hypothetical protein AAF841_04585 [Pseudomonadota bacterium]
MRKFHTSWIEQPSEIHTEYEKEQHAFAKMKAAVQRRKRARLRLWLGLIVAGRRAARR